MKSNRFPAGWDEERVQKLLDYYEAQNSDEILVEDEVVFQSGETVMTVPHALVPAVRELIAKHRNS
jgi:hypothetical protein